LRQLRQFDDLQFQSLDYQILDLVIRQAFCETQNVNPTAGNRRCPRTRTATPPRRTPGSSSALPHRRRLLQDRPTPYEAAHFRHSSHIAGSHKAMRRLQRRTRLGIAVSFNLALLREAVEHMVIRVGAIHQAIKPIYIAPPIRPELSH
jgi:hypothetical protein